MTEHKDQTIYVELRHMREMLEEIRAQVLRTNGRVSALEKWKYGILCAIATLAATKFPYLKTILAVMGGG